MVYKPLFKKKKKNTAAKDQRFYFQVNWIQRGWAQESSTVMLHYASFALPAVLNRREPRSVAASGHKLHLRDQVCQELHELS